MAAPAAGFAAIRRALSHVLWMGGSPCAGKSTIAAILAARYSLAVYECDQEYEKHLARATPDEYPILARASKASWDDVWMHPVEEITVREFNFYREEFGMVIGDLLAMPSTRPILAEGAALLPECVAPLLTLPQRSIWVVPTEEFQRREYSKREWVGEILAQCRRPEEAWENWMGRDAEFARRVAQQASALGLAVLTVDGSRSIEQGALAVAAQFGLD